MLSIEKQIGSGKLVCPVSHQRLLVGENYLQSTDGQFSYPLVNGVPVLLDREKQQEYLAQQNGAMEQVYANNARYSSRRGFFDKLTGLGGDYRNNQAQEAFRETIEQQEVEALCLSIGGGPLRAHPKLVNLNISLFQNVDIVGDAYSLPYDDGSVDSIYCEAVLEHLEYPNQAVSEMYRTLRARGQVFAATPFLQVFHAYPNHFQNFTLVGHQRLFERAGFEIMSSGVCVGPTFAVAELLAVYLGLLPTRLLSGFASRGVRLLSVALRPIDLVLNRHPSAHILASTTYVHAIKPE